MRFTLSAAVMLSIALLALAQDAPSPQVVALKKEIAELQNQRSEARRAAEQSAGVADLRKQRDESMQAAMELEKNDPGIAAASKSLKEAQAAYDKLLNDKIAASPQAGDVNKARAKLEAQRNTLMLDDQIAQLKLTSPHSPVQLAMDKDEELASLRKAYQAVDPKDRAARDAAHQKYDEARKARMAQIAEAKPLLDERAKIKEALADLDKQARDLDSQFREIRDTVRKASDADLTAAAEKVSAAMKQLQAARDSEKLKGARDKARAATQALHEKVSQILDSDPKTKDLKAAIEAKSAQLAELQKKNKRSEK